MSKRCRIVCDTEAGVRECELELADDASIAMALEAARALLGEQAATWDSAPTGIFGLECARSHVPADGDRIELYRRLPIDPRASRRLRAAAAVSDRQPRAARGPGRRGR